jgi:3-hydroxyacyl-CoA dehydrogenase
MASSIQRVAVIGAGVMGSRIAAHIANAGVPVLLLDLPSKERGGERNKLLIEAMERLLKEDPAPFMSREAAKLVSIGNLEDDIEKVKGCDWLVEAIIEKLEPKRELYAKLEEFIRPDTLISSNTSTIPLCKLVEGRSKNFQENFAITHFFNPPRYMRLLEVVRGPHTSLKAIQRLEEFCDVKLGKEVVFCNDTPGFIGNRIGIFWLQTAMVEAIDAGLTVEEVDAVFSRPMGIPKTGVFGLIDLIGLDLVPLIAQSMRSSLPPEDPYCQHYRELEILKKMIAQGYIGRKGPGGFYRITHHEGVKTKESINLKTGQYHPSLAVKLPDTPSVSQLRVLLSLPDRLSQYAWKVLSEVLCYAASLVPEITDDVASVDIAMKLGYNWKYGPFELLDKIGIKWFLDKLRDEGRSIPPLLQNEVKAGVYQVQKNRLQVLTLKGTYKEVERRDGCLLLSDIKLTSSPVIKNSSASLWDIGEGVACLEFHSKMNTIDPDTIALIRQSLDTVKKDFHALVIYNEGENFSAGANIGFALFSANVALWPSIYNMVREGQETYKALKYASFPVVSAPAGMALGGGCEILLHSAAVQAHAETYIGLVEVGVGLIPAWGGCKEMLIRWLTHSRQSGGPVAIVSKVFETIGRAKVAKSAAEAKELLYLRLTDGITMNRNRLLADAKAKALSMLKDFTPSLPIEISLPGATARIALNMAVKVLVKTGKVSLYDEEISKKLAFVLTGGDHDITDKLTEEDLYTLEHEAFMTLIKDHRTLARMEHMLETGKPLRN